MGENAKVKGTRKVSAAGKRKNEGGSAASALPSFLPLYFRVRTFSIQRTARLSRSLEKASESITSDSMLTVVNPESDAHPSFFECCYNAPQYGERGEWSWVLPCHMYTIPWMAVESEIPSFARGCALIDSKGTGPGNTKSSVRKVFMKDAVLHPQWKSRKQQIRKWGNDSERNSVILVILLLLSYYKLLIKWVINTSY